MRNDSELSLYTPLPDYPRPLKPLQHLKVKPMAELSDFGSSQRCIVTQNDALAISAANLKAFDVFESGVDRSESG